MINSKLISDDFLLSLFDKMIKKENRHTLRGMVRIETLLETKEKVKNFLEDKKGDAV